MGVPGLWAELADAGTDVSLTQLAFEHFEQNSNALRGLRLGIDASLWLFHARQGQDGSNPELRTLFFRLCRLLALPILPLFVFDGPGRPSLKRGKSIKGVRHPLQTPFVEMIQAFGFQAIVAPGEAEAELACLNKEGTIDAVMTDDVDALVFGAQVIVRNWGTKLSGALARSAYNKAQASTRSSPLDLVDEMEPSANRSPSKGAAMSAKAAENIVTVYKASDVAEMPEIFLNRNGLILVALMAGGDYDVQGLFRCGVKTAVALAQAGFGESLIRGFTKLCSPSASASTSSVGPSSGVPRPSPQWDSFIDSWREKVREELRTNSRGFLSKRWTKLAADLPSDFLNTAQARAVLASYVWPLTSQSSGGGSDSNQSSRNFKWGEPNVSALTSYAQRVFCWDPEDTLKRLRSVLWPGLVVRALRRNALEKESDGAWGELVDSPKSKVPAGGGDRREYERAPVENGKRKERLAQGQSKGKGQKQRALHDTPTATRISNFFAAATLASPPKGKGKSTDASANHENEESERTLLLAVHGKRTHNSTGGLLEYRLSYDPYSFVQQAQSGIDPELYCEEEDNNLFVERVRGADDGAWSDAEEGSDLDRGLSPPNMQSTTSSPTKSQARTRRALPPPRAAPTDPLRIWLPSCLLLLDKCSSAKGLIGAQCGALLIQAHEKQLSEAEAKKAAAAKRASQRGKKRQTGTAKGKGQATLDSFFGGGTKRSDLPSSQSIELSSTASKDEHPRVGLRLPPKGATQRTTSSSSASSSASSSSLSSKGRSVSRNLSSTSLSSAGASRHWKGKAIQPSTAKFAPKSDVFIISDDDSDEDEQANQRLSTARAGRRRNARSTSRSVSPSLPIPYDLLTGTPRPLTQTQTHTRSSSTDLSVRAETSDLQRSPRKSPRKDAAQEAAWSARRDARSGSRILDGSGLPAVNSPSVRALAELDDSDDGEGDDSVQLVPGRPARRILTTSSEARKTASKLKPRGSIIVISDSE